MKQAEARILRVITRMIISGRNSLMAGYAAWNVSGCHCAVRDSMSTEQRMSVAETCVSYNLKGSEYLRKNIRTGRIALATVCLAAAWMFSNVSWGRGCSRPRPKILTITPTPTVKPDTDTNINTKACTNTEANINTCTGHC